GQNTHARKALLKIALQKPVASIDVNPDFSWQRIACEDSLHDRNNRPPAIVRGNDDGYGRLFGYHGIRNGRGSTRLRPASCTAISVKSFSSNQLENDVLTSIFPVH